MDEPTKLTEAEYFDLRGRLTIDAVFQIMNLLAGKYPELRPPLEDLTTQWNDRLAILESKRMGKRVAIKAI